jgi:hypothetical protein
MATKEKLTKREAVRRALAAGKEKPAEIVEFTKGLGVVIDPKHVSVIKSALKKAGAGSGADALPDLPPPTPDEPPDAGLECARAVRELVKRFGPEMVKLWVEFITEE